MIAEFGRRFPDVRVVLLEGSDTEVGEWLDDRVIDIGMVAHLIDPTSPGEAVTGGVLLAQDRMVAVLDCDHPLAGERGVSLCDLSDDPFLISDGGCEPLLRQMYDVAGIEMSPARRVRDMATLLALVRERLGVTVVPELALSGMQGLAAVPVLPAACRQLTVVAADREDLSLSVRTFLELAGHRAQRRAE